MDDLEKPGTPGIVWILVGVLAIIGTFTIIGWLFSAVFMMIRLALVVLVVVLVVGAMRAFTRR